MRWDGGQGACGVGKGEGERALHPRWEPMKTKVYVDQGCSGRSHIEKSTVFFFYTAPDVAPWMATLPEFGDERLVLTSDFSVEGSLLYWVSESVDKVHHLGSTIDKLVVI